MRRSIPGQQKGNSKSVSQPKINMDKKQPTNYPKHDPQYEMQYGCSRKTGYKAGGHFWNPPEYCEMRIINCNHERWVNVGLCKQCYRHKSRTCPAALLEKIQYVDGKPVYDEPCNRKPKRLPRHLSAKAPRDSVKTRPKRRS